MSTRDAPARIGDLPSIGRPATTALLEAGITRLEQIASFGRSRLLALHGVGPKAVRILDDALHEHGLRLHE